MELILPDPKEGDCFHEVPATQSCSPRVITVKILLKLKLLLFYLLQLLEMTESLGNFSLNYNKNVINMANRVSQIWINLENHLVET